MGDSIAANLFMMGYAWQKGLHPAVGSFAAARDRTEWRGRRVEQAQLPVGPPRRRRPQARRKTATPAQAIVVQMPQSLDSVIKKRVEFLTGYQNAAYAAPTPSWCRACARPKARSAWATSCRWPSPSRYFKLMAYKDEYEVARLYTDGRFVEQLKTQFEGEFSLKFNLAPPLFARKDAKGHLVKAEFGSWMWSAFKLLAKLKGLRGGAFDVFGYTAERKMERALIGEYRQMIEALLRFAGCDQPCDAVELAALPEQIRGFGHVKEKAVAEFRACARRSC
jgi:indolepyruvate ferredoxin oxidoreductase